MSDFQTTHWSVVLAARGDSAEAKAALASLCETYYQPVLRYVERSVSYRENQNESARELTHEFFAKLLAGRGFPHLDPHYSDPQNPPPQNADISNAKKPNAKNDNAKQNHAEHQNEKQKQTKSNASQTSPRPGRFRTYLLGAVKHFLADSRKKARAVKRGGEMTIPLDTDAIEILTADSFPPDAWFDRQWGLTLVSEAIRQLQTEWKTAAQRREFESLKPFLMETKPAPTSGSQRAAIHRLRKKFRQKIREQISITINSPEEIDSELNYLIQVLAVKDRENL